MSCAVRSLKEAKLYLKVILGGLERERFVMLCLDNKNTLLKQIEIEGTADAVVLPIQQLIHEVARVGASGIVIAHNHPDGDLTPSRADTDVTRAIAWGCRAIGVICLDHLIIAGDAALSFHDLGLL